MKTAATINPKRATVRNRAEDSNGIGFVSFIYIKGHKNICKDSVISTEQLMVSYPSRDDAHLRDGFGRLILH